MIRAGVAAPWRRLLAGLALQPFGQGLALLRQVPEQVLDVAGPGAGREVAQDLGLLVQYLGFGPAVWCHSGISSEQVSIRRIF